MFSDSGLVGREQITLPYRDPAAFHVWNQYSIRVNGGRRDELKAYLADQGIGSEIYYPIPMHRQKCFTDFRIARGGLGETEAASAEILNLPIYPELRIDEQTRVVEAISHYFAAQAVRTAA